MDRFRNSGNALVICLEISTPINELIIKKSRNRPCASQPFSTFVYPLHKLNFTSYEKNTKMILLSLLLALMLPFFSLNAQTSTFKQGDLVFSAGLGLGANYGSYWGSYYKTSVPPIFITGDYCLREDLGPGNLGVGGIIAYSAYKDEPSPDWGYKYGTLFIGARGTYHFTDLVAKMDLYGGYQPRSLQIVNDKGLW